MGLDTLMGVLGASGNALYCWPVWKCARAENGKMTELARYLVRKGSAGWMVWDRHARAPARLEEGRPAIGLTEEQAREIKDKLTKKS